MKMSKMNLGNLTSTFLILTSFFCVQSAPAKPLNERSTELTWQAWILVDDQNQNNKQYGDDTLPRRKITPKSIFISPVIDACGPGYTQDSNGKCVKLVQLDNDAHMKFILDILNSKFSNSEDYDDFDETLPTPGPFQLNIPINFDYPADAQEKPNNVAIVVAPTNGNFDLGKNNSIKVNEKRDQNNTSQVDAPIIITKINIQDDDVATTEEIPTSTKETIITTTEEIPTTTEEITTETETTTTEIETTTAEIQALFFKLPPNDTLVTSEDRQTENFVRFPEEPSEDFIRYPQKLNVQLPPKLELKTKFREQSAEKLFEDFIRGDDLNDRRIFHNRDTLQQSTERVYNHRNRDKWLFPPTRKNTNQQKPLVFRFHNITNHRQGNNFYQHHPRQEALYREVPVDDLSHIFGFKRRSTKR